MGYSRYTYDMDRPATPSHSQCPTRPATISLLPVYYTATIMDLQWDYSRCTCDQDRPPTPPLLSVYYTVAIVAFPWADFKYTCDLDRPATPSPLPVYYTAPDTPLIWADPQHPPLLVVYNTINVMACQWAEYRYTYYLESLAISSVLPGSK